MKENGILIIGAGISGLSLGFFLHKAGVPFKIVEKENCVGGKIKSVRLEDYVCECGPNTVLFQEPVLKQMISELGLIDKIQFADKKTAGKRYILNNSGIRKIPSSPLSFITSELISYTDKIKILKEALWGNTVKLSDGTVREFFSQKFGSSVCDNLLEPFATGIYAGDFDKLSFEYTFPVLYKIHKKHKSLIKGLIKERRNTPENKGIFTFENGLSTIADRIMTIILKNVHLNTEVQSITTENSVYSINLSGENKGFKTTADRIIDTRPINEIEKCLGLKDYFPTIEYVPVKTIHLGFKRNAVSEIPEGFGALTTRNSKKKFLGSIFSSSIFPHTAPEGYQLYTVLAGGARNPEIALDSSREDEIVDDFMRTFKISQSPAFRHSFQWPSAIPQYNVGHKKLLDKISAFHKDYRNYTLLGNFFNGVSIGDRVKEAQKCCNQITGRG